MVESFSLGMIPPNPPYQGGDWMLVEVDD